MPSSSYTMPLRVSLYDLDWREEVSCASLLRYFEETAIRASGQLGFTYDWYKERGQFWVIRTMKLERRCAAHFQDELAIRTWVSSMTRVRADRNYLARRVCDDRVMARATANWVYLDAKTQFPTRIAPEIVAKFNEHEPPAIPRLGPRNSLLTPVEEAPTLSTRRAQLYETDSARHVNNAIYVDWLEEAVREALMARGYLLTLDAAILPWFRQHSLEYFLPARASDELQISTRMVGRGHSAGHWRQEIRRSSSGELLVRAESVTLWLDAGRRAAEWPDRKADMD